MLYLVERSLHVIFSLFLHYLNFVSQFQQVMADSGDFDVKEPACLPWGTGKRPKGSGGGERVMVTRLDCNDIGYVRAWRNQSKGRKLQVTRIRRRKNGLFIKERGRRSDGAEKWRRREWQAAINYIIFLNFRKELGNYNETDTLHQRKLAGRRSSIESLTGVAPIRKLRGAK